MNGAHAPEITKKTSKYASFLPAVPVMPPPPKEVLYLSAYIHMCIHPTHTRTCVPSVCGGGGGGLLYTKCSYVIALELWKICAQLMSVCASPLSCFEHH